MKNKKYILLISLLMMGCQLCFSQKLTRIDIHTSDKEGIKIEHFNGFQQPGYPLPLLSFRMDKKVLNTLSGKKVSENEISIENKIGISFSNPSLLQEGGFALNVTFRNISKDTLKIGNVVPFGESGKHVYLTAGEKGQPLSRSYLYRPNYAPVNVTLPDNLWELGMGIIDIDNGSSVVAIARRDRTNSINFRAGRFETTLYPGGILSYNLYMDSYMGRWQEGLRLMFNDRKLYDLPAGKKFDNTLYEREDLKWVRHMYVGHFTQYWNNYVYDTVKEKYILDDFDSLTRKYFGGNDHYMVWCGWPVIGLDQRNQFDLTRALPGGIAKQKEMTDRYKKMGTRVFTHFNPWDLPASKEALLGGTNYENSPETVSKICSEAGYSGLMFDTRSEAGKWFQDILDKHNTGVTIFPEGMATPANMEYCLIGRTHEALSMAPFLNLMRMIKPEFKIYRQSTIQETGSRRRDPALAFFNGHGVEFQLFVSPELDWVQDMYAFTGKTARILRENSDNFQTADWTPLLPTATDSIWVNEWPLGDKTIYTVYSLRTDGYKGMLFEAIPTEGFHYVDLWNHREATIRQIGSKHIIETDIEGFPAEYLGTDAEAAVGAFARLPKLLQAKEVNKTISLSSAKEGIIKIWQGAPGYDKTPIYESNQRKVTIPMQQLRKGGYEGDLIIQLIQGNRLEDEIILKGTVAVITQLIKAIYRKSKKQGSYSSPVVEANLELDKDLLHIDAKQGEEVIVYPQDMRTYPKLHLPIGKQTIKLIDKFGWYEGDFVLLVKQGNITLDSTNLYMPYNHPRIYSGSERTEKATSTPKGMVFVKGGEFMFKPTHYYDWLCNHPLQDTATIVKVQSLYIDKYPVTNNEFFAFMKASHYQPAATENFLKHWKNGAPVVGEENMPVVFVSYEDAKAYAKWAGKRLPTEKEWQYAAQAEDAKRIYPWGNEMDSTKCNPGNGILEPIGKHPQGANPLGIEDLVGSVWQMTNDWYCSGVRSYIMLKGSPYFNAKASWWYVQGGAKPLTNRQQWIRMSQSYERNGTVGFRLVMDAEER